MDDRTQKLSDYSSIDFRGCPMEVIDEATAMFRYHEGLLKEFAVRFQGDCTLNELRVITRVVTNTLEGKVTITTKVSKDLEIPSSTVSRCLTTLRAEGWVSEKEHPEDRRIRVIVPTEQTVEHLILAQRELGRLFGV